MVKMNLVDQPLREYEVEVIYLTCEFGLEPTEVARRLPGLNKPWKKYRSKTRASVANNLWSIYVKLGLKNHYDLFVWYWRDGGRDVIDRVRNGL